MLGAGGFRSVLSLDGALSDASAVALGLAEVVSVPLRDGSGNELQTFRFAVESLRRLAVSHSPVFVQCQFGRSRSAAVVAGYLMHTQSVDPLQARAIVASKRDISISAALLPFLFQLCWDRSRRPRLPRSTCSSVSTNPIKRVRGRSKPRMRLVSYLWAFPVTVVGLLLALGAAATGGGLCLCGGVVEAYGGVVGRLLLGGGFHRGGAAMALGHVILARDADCLVRSRAHELAHVRQFERWGPFLLPVYWLVSAWLWCRGYDPYLDHPFEPPPQ